MKKSASKNDISEPENKSRLDQDNRKVGYLKQIKEETDTEETNRQS